jgi:hypothetical protein
MLPLKAMLRRRRNYKHVHSRTARVLNEYLATLDRIFGRILGRICCPWWQFYEAAVICFETQLKCNKPFFKVKLPTREYIFRKTLYYICS